LAYTTTPPKKPTALLQATDAANAAYCPVKAELCAAAGVQESDVLIFEPQTTTTRPAYAVWVDKENKRIIWGFRGTTDLNVSCWGVLQLPWHLLDYFSLPRV
jgi:hypothetical protein